MLCRTLTEAVRWAAATQGALTQLTWPPAVLQWAECAEEMDVVTNRPLWRGLRVRMGIAFGRPQFRKPLNTGGFPHCGSHPGRRLTQPGCICRAY